MIRDPYIFFRYYQLNGDDEKLLCPSGHGAMHPFVDPISAMPYFECLGCTSRITPGIDLYTHMKLVVDSIDATHE